MPPRPDAARPKPRPLNRWLLGGFLVLVAARFTFWFPRWAFGTDLNEWVYTDWLIDYSAGFVRRGLVGGAIRVLSAVADPHLLVSTLIWAVFVGFGFVYLRRIARSVDRLSPPTLAGLLFLPCLLPFYLYDDGAFGRKETVGYLVLAWHLSSLTSTDPGRARSYLRKAWPAAALALPLHVLIHESSVLLFVPIHVLISHTCLSLDASLSRVRRLLVLAALYTPLLLAFAGVLRFGRTDLNVALAIFRHWQGPAGLATHTYREPDGSLFFVLPGAIGGLAWTFSEATAMSQSLTRQAVAAWLVTFGLLGWATVQVGSQTLAETHPDEPTGAHGPPAPTRQLARTFFWKYFALPLLGSLPIYWLGWDLGRWFAVTCFNYTLATLSGGLVGAERRRLADAESAPAATTTPRPAGLPGSPAWQTTKALAVLPVIVLVRLPPCCIDDADTSAWLVVCIVRFFSQG